MKVRPVLAFVLCSVFAVCVISGCSKQSQEKDKSNLVAADILSSSVVNIISGDKRVTVEDCDGLTVNEILAKANIELTGGQIVTIDDEQVMGDDLTIRIIEPMKVTIVINQGQFNEKKTVVDLYSGTVGDALKSAGITMEDGDTINYSVDAEVTDGMKVLISPADEPAVTEETGSTKEADATEKPVPSQTVETTAKTVVSTVDVPDCDGSGHGAKIITYSDGSQEEVWY